MQRVFSDGAHSGSAGLGGGACLFSNFAQNGFELGCKKTPKMDKNWKCGAQAPFFLWFCGAKARCFQGGNGSWGAAGAALFWLSAIGGFLVK